MAGWVVVCGAQDLNHECKLFHGKTMSYESELSKHNLVLYRHRKRGHTFAFFFFLSYHRELIIWRIIVTATDCSVTFNKLWESSGVKATAGKIVAAISKQCVLFSCFINSLFVFYRRRRSSFHGNRGGHFLWDAMSSNKNTGVERCVWLCPVLF